MMKIASIEYQARREMLIQLLPDNSMAIVSGYGLRYMTQGIFYPFHQCTSFKYLTGINEPDCCLVIHKISKSSSISTLYLHPADKSLEQWDGPKIGLKNAVKDYNFDASADIRKLPTLIEESTSKYSHIFSNLPLNLPHGGVLASSFINTLRGSATHPPGDSSISSFLSKLRIGKSGKAIISQIDPIIDKLRMVKSSSEIGLMRKAGQIAGRSFQETMRQSKNIKSEHKIQAVFEFHSKMNDAVCLSYVPVVAGGDNALILHYTKNNQMPGELLLMDAGIEYADYVSDITRTWPESGTFSAAQSALYMIVLNIQKEIIEKCIPGNNLDSLHDLMMAMLTKQLSTLFGRRMTSQEVSILCPHHVSHFIGMDVHDCPSVHRSHKLEAGNCATVEPGLYIPQSDRYPKEFRGIGIRIEDDIFISESGPIILSIEAPKEIIDIENMMI